METVILLKKRKSQEKKERKKRKYPKKNVIVVLNCVEDAKLKFIYIRVFVLFVIIIIYLKKRTL